MTVAFLEFAFVIDTDQTRPARHESGPAAGNPDRLYGLYEEIQGDPR
ncbi:hypothetical protein [Streptomyces sp. NBC_00989]|nr:hypothetical protein OG714_01075 [Streptomyces sp. NBC_00989]